MYDIKDIPLLSLMEGLDLNLLKNGWTNLYVTGVGVDCAAINLDTWTSDHCPVLMDVHGRGHGLSYKRRRSSQIHYEDM